MTVSQTFLVFDDFEHFEGCYIDSCTVFLQWELSYVISMIELGYGFGEEGHEDEVPFSLHHIRCTHYQRVHVSLWMLMLISSQSDFTIVELLFVPPFHAILLGGSSMHNTHLRSGELSSTP